MAFSKHLEEIIEAALADGVITDKERAVLHKKAQQEGVDPDEVDVVIEGRLQQKYNEVEAAKQKIRKCPSCGEIIPAMSAVCPNCGHVIDITNGNNRGLEKYMNSLEKELVNIKEYNPQYIKARESKAKLESMIRQGKALYGDNEKVAGLISEVEMSLQKINDEQENYELERKYKKSGCLVGIFVGIFCCFAQYLITGDNQEAFWVLFVGAPLCYYLGGFIANLKKKK